MLIALFSGLGLGFAGSIPLAGPTSVIVVESALENRPRRGLTVAIGAAIAEGLYAGVAFWGLKAVLANYPLARPISRLVASTLLCAVGLYLIFRRVKRTRKSDRGNANDRSHQLAFGFTITALNPTLLVTWAVAAATLHAALPSSFTAWDALPYAIGVGLGVVGWFWILVRLACRFRKSVGPTTMNRILQGTGVVLVTAGVLMGGRTLAAIL
jgi:threonine/homoserine/homoserine lactone efflux protein